jgi:DNA-binding NarL/FixJ family response regulator
MAMCVRLDARPAAHLPPVLARTRRRERCAFPGESALRTRPNRAGFQSALQVLNGGRPPMSCRVALVDDHRLFREGLRVLLASQPDLQVVGEAAEPGEACALVDAEDPDLVVVDVLLGTSSGVALAREMLRRAPRRRVLMLSMVLDEEHAAEALEVGALGYAGKAQALDEVLEAIRTVAAGRVYLPMALSRFVVQDYLRLRRGDAPTESPLNRLTRREREVFDLIIVGGTTASIAMQLAISHRTVETHRSRMLHKLRARSAADLVRLAARLKLLPKN